MAPFMNHFTFLQTISILCVMVTMTCTGSSLSHIEECYALFQFKQTIIHQVDMSCAAHGSQVLHSWNTNFDCCSWKGVACSNNHDQYHHVIGLNLRECSLCVHINSNNTLFSLVHLQRLDLSGNDFGESEIPSEISSLKQLRSLDLFDSRFSGQIPNGILHLMQLSFLDLSRNALKLHTPSLKHLVQNLTGLEALHLSEVDISSSIPHFLANVSSLRSIQLRDCFLRNEFPVAILELPMLEVLYLEDNTNLNGSLPESISHLKQLTVLSLGGCSFSGAIPRSLSNLTQLTYLGLNENKFTGFVPSLVSLSKLDVWQLSGNRFEKGHFPNWLKKLTKLSQLYVSDMNIKGEISLFLSNLTTLSVVEMAGNSLTGGIPSWFFNYTQMTNIELQINQLQGPIPVGFSNFKSLEYLDLGRNNFSGRVELDMFLGLNKLEELSLGYNKISLEVTNNCTNATLPKFDKLDLSSCNLKEFPPFLRFQNRMSSLLLAHNNIDGLVPVWIWNNSRETLELIEFSSNSITDFDQHPPFPPWINLEIFCINNNQLQGKLPIPPQTTVLYDVSYNKLRGEIPPWICEMKYLKVLDLSFNNMRGTLPSCLGILSNSLTALNLRRNKFHGKMMNAFMSESNSLKDLDLSENRFTGPLASSLKNCTNLEILCLGDNSFDGHFPFWLGTLSNLQVLVLRSNKLYGQIQGPTTVSSQFPKLRIIDLSHNSFSGQLDQNYFQTWNAMNSDNLGVASIMELDIYLEDFESYSQYKVALIHKGVRIEYEHILTIDMSIDLSCNKFEGEIPRSIQDLRGLQSLNLSNNHFTGCLLPSLWHLKNLEALDISRNELSGKIPQQWVELDFLEIFNVSFNHLEGRIPHGKQFDTFDNDSYMGNPQLCGKPLSKDCEDSKMSRLPPTSIVFESESFFPSKRIDWIFVFCGVGSGLVVGVVNGNFLYERYSDRFIKMKDKWVRPLRNTRRN